MMNHRGTETQRQGNGTYGTEGTDAPQAENGKV